MRRPLQPEEVRIWTAVARTVRPHRGRTLPEVAPEATGTPAPGSRSRRAGLAQPLSPPAPPVARTAPAPSASSPPAPALRPRIPPPIEPDPIEPGRKRRLTRERDPIEARIDLHGLGQFAAEDQLKAFLFRARDRGLRAVLVITGKGSRGDGVIRRRLPDWLADPALRDVVAGFSPAHRRHGGDGAVYVALKRRAGCA